MPHEHTRGLAKPSAGQRRQAKAGQERLDGGKLKPTKGQKAAMDAVAAYDSAMAALDVLAVLPKKHYVDLAGKPSQTLHNHADNYGVPCRGHTVNVGEVLAFFHQFLVDNQSLLKSNANNSDWRELERQETYFMTRMKRLEKAGQLVPKPDMEELMMRVASIFHGLGDQLERTYGPDAREMVNTGLASFLREVEAEPTLEVGVDVKGNGNGHG